MELVIWRFEDGLKKVTIFNLRVIFCAAAFLFAGTGSFSPRTAFAASDPDVDAWFDRHGEAEWKEMERLWEEKRQEMTAPVENLVLPLEYWGDGRVKARLFAKKAQVLDFAAFVFAEGVRVELLTPDGHQDGLLRASDCLFVRKNKRGYCRGEVSVVKGGDRFSGKGMYFSLEDRFVKILSECEIRTTRFSGTFGRLK
ncbi:MAG: hypothetical protein IJR99_14480 [Kiritimatiellae bacterium]|nr:hypothetical protein [Kiritimatiellia bacterium]